MTMVIYKYCLDFKLFANVMLFIVLVYSNGNLYASKENYSLLHSTANAGKDSTICTNTIVLYGSNPEADETGKWDVLTGTGILSNVNSPVSGLTFTSGIIVLSWTINNTITSDISIDTLTIINNKPTVANAGAGKIVCAAATTLSGNNFSTGETGVWYRNTGSSTVINPNARNTSITGLSSGINVFSWVISKGTCQSVSTVSVNFNKSNAGTIQVICTDNTSFNASLPTVNAGFWIQVSPSGWESNIADINDPQSTVADLSPGVNVFKWTTQNIAPNSCSSQSNITITSNIVTNSNADTDQSICSDSVFLSGNTPLYGSGAWVKISGSGNIVNSSVAGTKIKNLSPGNNTFAWKITNGSCVSMDTVNYVNNSPTKANAGIDLAVCNSQVTLNASPLIQGLGLWHVISGTGIISDSTANNTLVNNLGSGVTAFIWKSAYASCPGSYDTIYVTRSVLSPAYAGVNKYICRDTITLLANNDIGNGRWKIISGTGNIASPTNYKTLIFNVSINGVTTLEWEFTTPGCSFTKDTVEITRDFVTPAVIMGGNNISICADSIGLNGNIPSLGSGVWTILSGMGTFKNSSFAKTTVTGLAANLNILEWRISSTYCNSMAVVTIVNNKPTWPLVGTSKNICINNDTLKANSPVGIETGTWTVTRGSGTFNPLSNISNVSNLAYGLNTFKWTIKKSSCSLSDSVSFTNNSPSLSIAGKDSIICRNSINLYANTVQGLGTWIIKSGSASVAGINNHSTDISSIAHGKNVFIWSVTSGMCPASIDSISIYNNTVVKPVAGNDTCIITPNGAWAVNLSVTSPNPSYNETGNWTGVFPGSVFFVPSISSSLPKATVTGLNTGFYRFIWNVNDETFTCLEKDTLDVSIIPLSNSGTDQCITRPLGLSSMATALVSGNVLSASKGELGRWLFVSNTTSPQVIPALNSITGSVSDLRSGLHKFKYRVFNASFASCYSEKEVNVTVVTKASAGNAQCLTGINSSTLLANDANPINTLAGGKGTWSSAGTAAISGYPTGNITGLIDGVNKFYITNTNLNYPACKNVDSVTVTILTKPDAGKDTFLIISPSTGNAALNLYANTVNSGIGETSRWFIISGSEGYINMPTLPNSSANFTLPGVNAIFWRILNTISGCALRDTTNMYIQTKSNAGNSQFFTNATHGTPFTITLTSVNTLQTGRGEMGFWQLHKTISNSIPVSLTGTGIYSTKYTNVGIGVNVFRWTVFNTNFPGHSNSSDMTVTGLTKALAGDDICTIGINDTVAGNTSVTIPVYPAFGEKFSWTSSNPSVIIIPQSDSILTSEIKNLAKGTTKIFLKITNTITGFSDRDTLLITNITKPLAGSDTSLCMTSFNLMPVSFANLMLNEYSTWKLVFGKGTISGSNINPFVNGLDTGKNIFTYSIKNGGCLGIDTIIITNNNPYLSTITADSNTCFTFANLIGNNPALQFPSAKGKWTIISQPGSNFANFANDSSYTTQINNMDMPGNYQFQWAVTNKGCGPKISSWKIRRDSYIFASTGSQIENICSDTYIMNANKPQLPALGTWQLKSGGSDFLTDIHNPNMTVTGIAPTDNIFQWKVTNASCEGIDEILIHRDLNPSIAKIGSDTSMCETDTIHLTSITFPGLFIGARNWSIIEGGGSISTPNAFTTAINDLSFNKNAILYKITNGSCPVSSDTLFITRYKHPAPIYAGRGENICGKNLILNASVQDVGIGTWKNITSDFSSIINNIHENITSVTGLDQGIYKFQWMVKNGTCIDSSFVIFDVKEAVTQANIFGDTLICDTVAYNLKGNNPLVGKGEWQTLDKNIIRNDTIPETVSYIKNFGDNKFTWTISKDFCSSSDTITVYVAVPPTKANAGRDTTICNDNLNINGNNPVTGFPEWSSITSGLVINNSLTANSYLTSLAEGNNIIIYKIMNLGCPSSIDTLTVEYRIPPKAFAGSDTIICTDSTFLNANGQGDGNGLWTIIEGSGKFIDNQDSHTQVTGINTGENIFQWSLINSNCPASVSQVKVINNKVPSIAPFIDKYIYSDAVQLEAAIPSNGSGQWRIFYGRALIEDPFNSSTMARNIGAGETIFKWTITNKGCDSTFALQKIIMSDLRIPEGFSPNNDGSNDKFYIEGISEYQGSKLEIFNRSGKLVYINEDYQNSWDGKTNKNEVLGNDTYFYLLNLSNGKSHKGFVVLNR